MGSMFNCPRPDKTFRTIKWLLRERATRLAARPVFYRLAPGDLVSRFRAVPELSRPISAEQLSDFLNLLVI
jgi:hypothetical protein